MRRSLPSQRWPLPPSVVNHTSMPRRSRLTSASETWVSTVIVDRSAMRRMVGACWLAFSVWPCRALIDTTVPSIGATMRVYSRLASSARRLASVCSICARSASIWALAARSWASAVCSASRVVASSAIRLRWRRACVSASSSVASRSSSCACCARSWARVASTRLESTRGSISASSCPAVTWSPTSTWMRSSRPDTWAPTSTYSRGCSVPVAVTTSSSRPRCTVARLRPALASLPVIRPRASQAQAASATTAAPTRIRRVVRERDGRVVMAGSGALGLVRHGCKLICRYVFRLYRIEAAGPRGPRRAGVSAFRNRDEAHLGDAGVARLGHHLGDELVARVAVGAQVQLGLRFLLRGLAQPLRHGVAADRLVVPVQLALAVHGQRDRVRLLVRGLAGGLGQVDLHGVREQRRRDHEHDQQHQHHVDERDHVDLAHLRRAALLVESSEGHHAAP